jgi:glycosyltransferase involved in cell wall biosynthesis
VLTVAYLANLFPSAVEPYVGEEIAELRRRGVRVIAGSVRKPAALEEEILVAACPPEIVLQPLRVVVLLRALLLCVCRWKRISPLLGRIVFRGPEDPIERVKALLHTWMGACYALRLEGRGIEHIHVHHGYFGSWIAMVAARLLDVGFSMTLHGSDLLLRAAYLDAKLARCTLCLTVSEYNRRYILEHYPTADPQKVVVSRLGVDVNEAVSEQGGLLPFNRTARAAEFTLLAAGRLCAVKDHAFLVRACAHLRTRNVRFECFIAGDGPERRHLQSLIRKYDLEGKVTLLEHVPRAQMDALYDRADVVVLTSRSEGIPLVLMEAMARGKIVLAPAITGIPELVIPGKTGFLYQARSLDDFVDRLLFIRSLIRAENHPYLHPGLRSGAGQLEWIRHAARVHVHHNFNRQKNLEWFARLFLQRAATLPEGLPHENFVLQQIQPPLQRHRSVPV